MYESYFNLTGKPFQLSPDPQFFFRSRGHWRALAYLRYGITQAEGFVVVTGDVGTGKSTLVRMLFAELEEQDNVVGARVETTQLPPEEFLRMVVSAFGLTPREGGKANLLHDLHAFLGRQAREGKRALLVVDEAQNLPAESLEELHMLSNFQEGDKPLLQSFLLGQVEFRRALESPNLEQFRQRVTASCHLNPMNGEETRGYIEHRLKRVGWKQDPEVTPAAFRAIHEFTGGLPRRINTLCDRLLLYAFLEEVHRITEATVKAVTDELALEPSHQKSGQGEGQAASAGSHGGGSSMEKRLGALEARTARLEDTLGRVRALFKNFPSPAPRG